MTYFADLSYYWYDLGDEKPTPARNVGWLGPGAPFSIAAADEEFAELLWAYCKIRVNETRGLYPCHLCQGNAVAAAERDGERLLLGSAEIRVFAKDGAIFASPNLIYHYVSAHKYLPPAEFIDAVRTGPHPGSEEYFVRLVRHGAKWN